MKVSVKALAGITILLCFTRPVTAQLRLPISGGLTQDIRTILEDYPNAFTGLMGDLIMESPQSAEYSCKVKLRQAENCFFTRYAGPRNIASWEALMLTTEDFEKASKEFRSLYQQLNHLTVKAGGGAVLKMNGDFEKPDEAKKFTAVILADKNANENFSRLRLEILLQAAEPLSWKVKLLIYDHEREDWERGAVRE